MAIAIISYIKKPYSDWGSCSKGTKNNFKTIESIES